MMGGQKSLQDYRSCAVDSHTLRPTRRRSAKASDWVTRQEGSWSKFPPRRRGECDSETGFGSTWSLEPVGSSPVLHRASSSSVGEMHKEFSLSHIKSIKQQVGESSTDVSSPEDSPPAIECLSEHRLDLRERNRKSAARAIRRENRPNRGLR
jgi:hypothetical protein